MKNAAYLFISFLFLLSPFLVKAQPFVDIVNMNAQVFGIKYKDSSRANSLATTYNGSVFIPKKFVNDNMFLFRLSGEVVQLGKLEPYENLYAFGASVGFQFVSKSKNWKAAVVAMPKLSSDLRDNISKNDFQFGGTTLFNYVANDTSLKIKFGLYYNRECFGNFFVPLAGIDWKVNKRLSVYGILPNNMRVEYKICRNFYTGIGYKNYQRSYRLGLNDQNDFVRIKESQAKVFFDFFVWKHALLFADVAYMLKYSLIRYDDQNKNEVHASSVYAPMENNIVFTFGFAYRLRLD
ncbi:MAG: hypothetical protein ABIQ40_09180 [Bacteroidia bacterium]